jgi:hypothetical protein
MSSLEQKGTRMKSTKLMLICLAFVLAACISTPTENSVDATANPMATATIPETLPAATTAPAIGQQPDQPGEHVEFEPGITSARRSGVLAEGEYKEYVLSATAAQSLHIQTVGYDAPVEFTLSSPDGDNWSGESGASDVYIFAVQVVLPEDGDYLVKLSVPPETGGTRYDVTFSIIPGLLSTSPSPTESPERVIFASGVTSAQVSSLLPSGTSVKQYVLAARVGQTMTIDIASDDAPISLAISSPSGIQLFTEADQTSPTDGGYRAGYSFTLAESGDYIVTLTKADHTPSTDYTVDFTIY